MGVPRTIGTISSVNQAITPVFTGPVTAAVSFTITNNIATIFLGVGNLPTTGYNGPNGYPPSNNSKFDIYGGVNGYSSGGPAGGQQVTLWSFATATYFNGKTITVLDNDPTTGAFRFYFTHANVANTADTGNTAPIPVQRYRAVRLECAQTLGTDLVYVGDLNVSSTRYIAALSLTGQFFVEVAGDNIAPDRIWIKGSNAAATDSVVASVIY